MDQPQSSSGSPPRANSQAKPITKSQFKLGLDCIQKLRHARNGLPQASQENEMLRLLSEGGAAIEALVHANEPGAVIGGFGQSALDESRQAIAKAFSDANNDESTSLYEVTIAHGGFLARLDLLRITSGSIELVEIKAKSADAATGSVADGVFLTNKGTIRSDWAAYIQDLAFQRDLLQRWLKANGDAILARADRTVTASFLLVNKVGTATAATQLSPSNYESTYSEGSRGIRATVKYIGTGPDASLIVEVPMDHIVDIALANAGSTVPEFANRSIPECMAAMQAIVDSDRWPGPRIALDSGCKSCEFRVKPGLESGFDRCWGAPEKRPEHHVLELARISKKQLEPALKRAGENATILDVAEADLTASQLRQYEAISAGHAIVDSAFAHDPLAHLAPESEGTIYFIDFETSSYPIPSRVGGLPYELIPFQFEGHSMPRASAGIVERTRLPGFLELVNPDPRRAFIDAMMKQVGEKGLIYHWHHFERTVLSSIKRGLQAAPEQGDDVRIAFIDSLAGADGKGGGRLIDLLPIAKECFYHPEQRGSYSIKKVIPIAWAISAIRSEFTSGHAAAGDPDSYCGETDPYDGLPAPPKSILEAVGGINTVRELVASDDGGMGGDEGAAAVRNGGMAMLAYHYVRMFGGSDDPAIVAQFRQYCQLDSAAMVMVYALMRDHVGQWRGQSRGNA